MILFFLKKDPIYLEREGQPTSRRRVFINVIVGARRPKTILVYITKQYLRTSSSFIETHHE